MSRRKEKGKDKKFIFFPVLVAAGKAYTMILGLSPASLAVRSAIAMRRSSIMKKRAYEHVNTIVYAQQKCEFLTWGSGNSVKDMVSKVPNHIVRPEYAHSGEPGQALSDRPRIYNAKEIVKARIAGRLARKMLDFANNLALQPNKYTTNQIDELTRQEIIKHGAYPSPLNYRGFPKSICTSINEVVCHGIPDDRLVRRGDKVSIDISLYIDGFHGDNCGTIVSGGGLGSEPEEKRTNKLILATQEALEKSILLCKPGACISSIGAKIQQVATSHGFKVVHEFCGHGKFKVIVDAKYSF